MIWSILRSARDKFFLEKTFPKIDLLKAMSIIMIANSEKMKMKKSYSFLVFLTNFIKNFSPYPIFWSLYPPTIKRSAHRSCDAVATSHSGDIQLEK